MKEKRHSIMLYSCYKTVTILVIVVISCICINSSVWGNHYEDTITVRTLDRRTPLAGMWKIKLDDNRTYADSSCDDSNWDVIELPGTIMDYVELHRKSIKGTAWLRRKIYIDPRLKEHDIGLLLGRIGHADETYFNGEKIGGIGTIRDDAHSMWNHPRHYHVPKKLINYGGDNVIAIHLYYYLYGEILGSLAITNQEDMIASRNISYFLLIDFSYIIIAMGIPFFILFLFLYFTRFTSKEYLYYCLQLVCGLFIILDYVNYWNVYGSTLYRFKLLGISWAALNVVHPIFLHRFYELKRTTIELLLWLYLFVVIIIAVFFTTETLLKVHGMLLIIVTTPIGLYNMSCHISAIINKSPYARLFSFFGLVAIIGAIHDGIVYYFKFAYIDPPWLFQSMIFHFTAFAFFTGNALILGTRFIRMKEDMDSLNVNLKNTIEKNVYLNNRLNESKKEKSCTLNMDKAAEKIEIVLDYIRENYREDISREGLAAKVNLHPDNLGRMFKMVTTKKIGDHINELRIQDAVKQLLETDTNIIHIAFSVGFDSLRTFNRSFVKVMGLTPEKYRKKHRVAELSP